MIPDEIPAIEAFTPFLPQTNQVWKSDLADFNQYYASRLVVPRSKHS